MISKKNYIYKEPNLIFRQINSIDNNWNLWCKNWSLIQGKIMRKQTLCRLQCVIWFVCRWNWRMPKTFWNTLVINQLSSSSSFGKYLWRKKFKELQPAKHSPKKHSTSTCSNFLVVRAAREELLYLLCERRKDFVKSAVFQAKFRYNFWGIHIV